jgi:hypothetical protein
MTRSILPSTPSERTWVALGLVLVAAQVLLIRMTVGLHHGNATTLAAVMPLILGVAIPTGLLLAMGPRLVASPPTPMVWVAMIGCGLLLRLVWLGQVPPLDDDYFRYLWDGAVVANGLDPYRYGPSEFLGKSTGPEAYARLAAGKAVQDILDNVNFNDMRTIYPGIAQAVFAAGYLIAPFKVDGLRLVFLAGEIATLVLLVRLLSETGRSPLWAALYWMNPFAALMTIGLVHVDAMMSPLVLGALLMHARGRSVWAAALIGLGAGVKIWPLLLAPMVLWPLLRQPRRAVLASLVLGVVLLAVLGPVLWSTLRPGSGLTAYAHGWTNNNAFYAWTLVGLKAVLGQGEAIERGLRLTLAAATAIIALAQAFRGRDTLDSILSRGLIVAACVFYLSPAQFPWYAVWFLPLAVLRGSWPLLLASAVLPFYYMFFPQWPVEQGSLFFYGIAFIHSVPVLAWLLYEAVKQRRGTVSDRASDRAVTGGS